MSELAGPADASARTRVSRDGTCYRVDPEGVLTFADRFPADWPGPPQHVHYRTVERFHVRSGRLTIVQGDVSTTLVSGQALDVPAGVPHTVNTLGLEGAEVDITLTPHAHMDRFFIGLAEARRRKRNLLLQIAVMHRAPGGIDFYFAGVPRRVQDAGFALLSPFAHALGYRADFDRSG